MTKGYCKLAFLICLQASFLHFISGTRPARLLDDGTAPNFPACSASYSTQCSFNNAHRIVDALAVDLENDAVSVLANVNDKVYNPTDSYYFSPFVFESTGMTCVANGRNTSFNGMTIEEIAFELNIVTRQRTQNQTLSSEIAAAANPSSDGWFEFIFTSEDRLTEPIAHFGYASQATYSGATYIVFVSFAKRTLPRLDVDLCPNGVNRLCSITNVRSLIGTVLTRAMSVQTGEHLREIWAEVSYPIDTSFRDATWYLFAYELDFPQRVLGHKNLNYVGMTHFNLTYSVQPDVTKANGTELHFIMANAALGGGGWATYDWMIGDQSTLIQKVSFLTGFELFGTKYMVGSGFNHVRDASVEATRCTTCSASLNEPCSIGNVKSLQAHAHVELLTNVPVDEIFDSLANSGEYSMDGGFGIALIRYDQFVQIDTLEPSSNTLEDVFIARGVDTSDVDAVHEMLKTKANTGGGWLSLPGANDSEEFVMLINKINKANQTYYLFNGYKNARAAVNATCSTASNGPCSEDNAKAIVGQVSTSMYIAISNGNLQSVFEEINTGQNASFLAGVNFYTIVLDDDFNLVAFGDPEVSEGWDFSEVQSYLTFVQQQQFVSSLGNEFLTELRKAAFEVGGGFTTVSWNNAQDGTIETRIVFVNAVKVPTTGGSETSYYVMSMFTEAPEAPLCSSLSESDSCPDNSYCVLDETSIPRCTCGFYYEASFQYINSSCTDTLTHETTMTCVVDTLKAGVETVKSIGIALGSINYILAIVCITWTIFMRRHVIVKASQPAVLVLVAVGTLISSTTIFFIVRDDSIGPPAGDGSNDIANWACMAQPWFYGLGFSITYCSMIVKLQRVARVFKGAAQMKRKLKGVSLKVTMGYLAGLLAIEAVVLLVWTMSDPLKFVRPDDDPINGSCKSPTASNFVIVMALYHLGLLFYGAYLSYKCRKMNGVFAETKYLSLAMISNLQVLLLALPVILLTAGDTETSTFIRAIAVFLNDFSTTCLIFLPKMYFCIHGPPDSTGVGATTLTKKTKSGPNATSSVQTTSEVQKTTTVAPSDLDNA